MKKISIVIPIHNESANIVWHFNNINKTIDLLKDYSFEFVYVDDGSIDDSVEIIKHLHKNNPKKVRYVALSRNFGKEPAVSAGLSHATGDAVLIIDGDGQHPIELLETFLEKWALGFDLVIGIRSSNQGEGSIKKYGSKLFYALLRLINGKQSAIPGITDFRLIDRKVVDEYNKLTERNRIARNLMDWLGFNKTFIPFEARKRHAGKASYSFRKLLRLALDGAVSHSTRPLKLISIVGFLISTVSIIAAVFLAIETYILDDPLKLAVTGIAILALFLSFLIGVVLVCQGLIALYLESVYYETQNRPLYVVKESDT